MDELIKRLYYVEYCTSIFNGVKSFVNGRYNWRAPVNVKAYDFINKYRTFEVEK